MYSLNAYERETIVNFDEGSDEATIYTFNAVLIRKCRQFVEKFPESGHLEAVRPDGGHEFVIKKNRLSINLLRPKTEAEIEALRERAKKNLAEKKFERRTP